MSFFYQSHQSGIETPDVGCVSAVGNATNRTNLELKLVRFHTRSESCILPIAPIWNWNAGPWPWTSLTSTLPIAPIWNWNARARFYNLKATPLPIAPIWNWNRWIWHTGPATRSYQSHQSGIETKESHHWGDSSRCYQSHQSGIETYELSRLQKSMNNYQSHQSGIETRNNGTGYHCGLFYQSHQSGIETMFKRYWKWPGMTTNRTNLELKRPTTAPPAWPQ